MLLTEISLHPFGWRLTSKIIRNPETRTRLKGKFVMSARGRGQVPEPSSDWTDVRRWTGRGTTFDY